MANLCKLMSCNVRGLGIEQKRRQLFHYLHINEIDIAFVQETHSKKAKEKLWKAEYRGHIIFDHGESNARGVAIMISKRLSIKVKHCICSKQGRYIIMEVDICGTPFVLVNIYAPNEDSPQFFQQIFEKIFSCSSAECIVAGDFNVTLSSMDYRLGNPTNLKSASVINSFMQQHNFVDVWREMHPNEFNFMWRKSKPKPSFKRLDYFLVSASVARQVTNTVIKPAFRSDHAFPVMIYKLVQEGKGPGYWKLNTSLLEEEAFVEEARSMIRSCSEKYADSFLCWEMIKMLSCGLGIQYSTRKKKATKNKLDVLNRKLIQLESELVQSSSACIFDQNSTENQIHCSERHC